MDQLQRFLFDELPVRGEHVVLEQSYQAVLDNHHYPPAVAALLGEFMAAVALLADSLKFEGLLTLQARSEGEVPLIMAECNEKLELRAIAREADQALGESFQTLVGNKGQLAITVQPSNGERYQGIVALEGNCLARCLEAYFAQSEQLRSHFILHTNKQRAAGILLQELPNTMDAEELEQRWQHLAYLLASTQDLELLNLSAEDMLYRLYHEEQVRLFPAREARFCCSCSHERLANALRSVGREELQQMLEEEGGNIELNCEFCNAIYPFSAADINGIFGAESPIERPDSLH